MTDITSTQTDHQEAAPEKAEQQPAEKTLTQAEVDRIVQQRLTRQKQQEFGDYDDLKAAAAELQTIKDASKTEQQKLVDQLTAVQKQLSDKDSEISKLTVEKLRAEVASTKGVPAGRLSGTTKEEIEADAEAYLSEIASLREAAPKRKPPAPAGLKSGASSSGDTSANPQERAAAALRELRRSGA